MTQALSIIRQIGDLQNVAQLFAQSGVFSDAKSQAQCFVKIMAGAEMGLTPFAAMNAFHFIQGKIAPTANHIASRIKTSGRYNYRVTEKTEAVCTIEFYENGEKIHTETWTAARAARAGTQNMNKFPDAMLFSRAITAGARAACPEVIGAYYTPDELGATVDEDGAPVAQPSQNDHNAKQVVDAPPEVAHNDSTWKDELKQLGVAANELMAMTTPDVATQISIALSTARDVLRRNGATTQTERTAAKAELQRVIAAANDNPLEPANA